MPPWIGSFAVRLWGQWPVIAVTVISAGLATLATLAPRPPSAGPGSLSSSAGGASLSSAKPAGAVDTYPPPRVASSAPSSGPRELLRPGDRGEDVRRVQAILKSLGYAIEVNGIFGESTRKAVLEFQSQQGLRQDGLVGPGTRRQLESAAFWHTTARGETLWELARTYGTTVELIMEVNDLREPAIRAGQRLLLPVAGYGSWSGEWGGYAVRPGDTLSSIAARFHVSKAELSRLNRIEDPDKLRTGQRLRLPGDLSERGERAGSARPASLFPLSWPLPGKGRISSGFGWRNNPFGRGGSEFHEGVDIAVRPGTRVLAAAPGVVVEAGWMGSYGYGVVIDHGRDVQTLYGHNARVLVQPGQRVERGQAIAISGSSGRSTGPHLDFRVRINGRLVNPLGYVRRP